VNIKKMRAVALFFAASLLLSSPVFAQTAPAAGPAAPVASTSTQADDLASLQAQIQLLTAKAQIAKLKQEIATASGAPTAPSSVVSNAPVPQTVSVEPPKVSGGMSAVTITAFNGVYRGVVNVNGEDIPVQPGQTIDGGWKVAKITDSEITLVRGKQTIVLRG
jgi:type IV pilus biogenesis protein PilP